MKKTVSHYRLWMLRLSFPFPLGNWLLGAIIFTVVWSVLSLLNGDISFYLKLFFVAMCAYIVPVFIHVIERSGAALNEISPLLDFDKKELNQWHEKLTTRSSKWTAVVTVISIVLWFAHFSFQEIYYGGSPWGFFDEGISPSMVGALFVWVTMTFAISALTSNAVLLAQISSRIKLDLLRNSGQVALARVAVISTFSIIGAQVLNVLLIIDTGSNWVVFAPGLVITVLPMLALFLIPIWPMHRRLKIAKQKEQQLIDQQLLLLRPTPEVDFDNHKHMEQLTRVLNYRREIRQASEWPFDIPVLIRLSLYLILPPLTWVGAALIENVVNAFI